MPALLCFWLPAAFTGGALTDARLTTPFFAAAAAGFRMLASFTIRALGTGFWPRAAVPMTLLIGFCRLTGLAVATWIFFWPLFAVGVELRAG